MQTLLPSNWIKVILIAMLGLLAAGSYFYNSLLISEIMEQERSSIELWAKALEFSNDPIHQQMSMDLLDAAQTLREIEAVPDSTIRKIENVEATQPTQQFVTDELILNTQYTIPTIVTDESGFIVHYRFIDEEDIYPELIQEYAAINDPIVITFGEGEQQRRNHIYFGESQTVQYLRYFPFFQFGILALVLAIGYMTYKSISRSEKSNLWVGMAKEAAHQLGTPLSSMYGWVQLLKDKHQGDDESLGIVYEVENDISRIRKVAERFNKIGSKPELKSIHIEPIIDQVIEYMERRLPQFDKKVDVRKSIHTNAKVLMNAELFQWAIENLIKNSMDAIRESAGDAYISVSMFKQGEQLIIDIEDSGTGIDRKYMNQIFKPGYSTKKRGWGLGLSLTKRIIEEYHDGKVFVLRSEVNVGTTIRIILPC